MFVVMVLVVVVVVVGSEEWRGGNCRPTTENGRRLVQGRTRWRLRLRDQEGEPQGE